MSAGCEQFHTFPIGGLITSFRLFG